MLKCYYEVKKREKVCIQNTIIYEEKYAEIVINKGFREFKKIIYLC